MMKTASGATLSQKEANMKEAKPMSQADLIFTSHGSIMLMLPATAAGRDWVAEHIPNDAQTFGSAIAIEPRYVVAIVEGACNDGLEVA